MCAEDKLIIGSKNYASCQKVFSAAGEIAARQAREAGLPLTYVLNDQIIKEYSDGRKEFLGPVTPGFTLDTRVIDL